MAKQYTVKELASKMDEISKSLYKDLNNIKEEIHNSVSNGDLNKDKTNILNKLEIFEKKTNDELTFLRNEIKSLSLTTQKILEDADNSLQLMHNRKILIHGIDDNGSNVYSDVLNALKSSKLNITKHDICNCYRLGKKLSNKKRPVVLEFLNQWRRDEIFYEKSELKGSSLLITEMLTRSNYRRFQECFKRFKKDCWTYYGKTIVKINDERVIISNDEQMKKVLNSK